VPRQATSKENDKSQPRISSRNIIASLIIAGFIAVAVVGIFFPLTFGIATILPTVLATLQLTSVSTAVLGLIAGATTFVAAALLYSIVVNTYDVLANRQRKKGPGFSTKSDSAEPLLDDSKEATRSEHKHDQKVSKISKLAGAVTGAIIGALTAALVKNPVASLYTLFRRLWNASGNPAHRAVHGILLILSPIWLPLLAILKYGVYRQGQRGWKLGFSEILGFNKEEESAFRNAINKPKDIKVSTRDFVASLVVIGLVVAAVLAVVLPPASLFIGIPAIAATIGLGSVGTAVLAVIAGATTFVVSTLLYGIGSQLADVFSARKQATKQASASEATRVNDKSVDGTYQRLDADLGPSSRATDAATNDSPVISKKGTTRGTSLWGQYAPAWLGGAKNTGFTVTPGSPYLERTSNESVTATARL
jgi:MFS family permease